MYLRAESPWVRGAEVGQLRPKNLNPWSDFRGEHANLRGEPFCFRGTGAIPGGDHFRRAFLGPNFFPIFSYCCCFLWKTAHPPLEGGGRFLAEVVFGNLQGRARKSNPIQSNLSMCVFIYHWGQISPTQSLLLTNYLDNSMCCVCVRKRNYN